MARLRFKRDGTVRALYADELLPIFEALGRERTVTRASWVEPDHGGWAVWIPALVGGSAQTAWFGPYKTRAEALRAEREYLEARL